MTGMHDQSDAKELVALAGPPSLPKRIDALTGIRGLACVWVVALHSYPVFQRLLALPPEAGVRPIRTGYLAVDMFFILSGFILSHRYLPVLVSSSATDLRDFAIGRVSRIMPLNWFMLAVLVAAAYSVPTPGWAPEKLDWTAFVASVFLVQSWGFADPLAWNFPAWSMSTEWAAYLLFPAMIWLVSRFTGSTAASIGFGISLAALAALMSVVGQGTLDHTGLLSLPRCFFEFFAGVCLYRILQCGHGLRGAPEALPDSLMVLGIAAVLAAVLSTRLELVAPFGFAALLAACALESRLSKFLFATVPVMFLGEISYSLYLSHTFVIYVFDTVGSGMGFYAASGALRLSFAAIMIALLLAVPTATWRYVELPGQAAGRRLVRAWRAKDAAD